MPNKFITNLDLARQAEIFSGETAVFKGGMQLGIPFSGFPTGVDTSTITPLTEGEGIEVQFAAFSGNTGTTVFNVTDPSSPYYSVSATTLSASPYTVIDEDTINITVSSTTYPTIMSFTAVTGGNGETLDYSFSQPVLQTLDSRGSYIGLFNFLGGVSIGTSFIDESFYNVGSVFSGANFNMEVVSLGSHGSTPAWVTGTTSGTVVEYSAMTQYWTDPTIIAYTSGLTLPITPESANTQTSDYIWTLTDSTIIDENLIGLKYTGYSVTYSFNDVAIDPESPSVIGATGSTSADTYYYGTVSATFQTYSAGTLDYKGSTNWLTIDGRATVEERFTTDRMTILNPDTGSSVSTLGIDVDGKVVTYTPTITSEVTGLTFDNVSYDLSLGLDNGTSFTDNLGILASDIKVTGGTYDNATGEMTFVNNSGGSFVISGLTTGSTLQEVLDVGSTYTGSDAISMITTSTIVDRGDTSYTAFGGSSASSGRSSSYLTPTDARFRLETGIGVYSELNLTSASMLITDLVNSKGLEYASDYSSNFTNRSLVDKEYVDGTSGIGTISPNTIPTMNPGGTAYIDSALLSDGTTVALNTSLWSGALFQAHTTGTEVYVLNISRSTAAATTERTTMLVDAGSGGATADNIALRASSTIGAAGSNAVSIQGVARSIISPSTAGITDASIGVFGVGGNGSANSSNEAIGGAFVASVSDGGLPIGVYSTTYGTPATAEVKLFYGTTSVSNSADNIGMKINISNPGAGNAYALQLVDGTETVAGGRFLKDTGSGKANWSSISSSDLPTNIALVGTYTNNYVPRWNATTNTLESGTIQDSGNNVHVGGSPDSTAKLKVSKGSGTAEGIYVDVTNGGGNAVRVEMKNSSGTTAQTGLYVRNFSNSSASGDIRGINILTETDTTIKTINNVFGIHTQNMDLNANTTVNNLYQLFIGDTGSAVKGTGEFYGIRQSATNVINRFSGGMRFDSIGSTTPVTNLGVDVSGNVVSGTTGEITTASNVGSGEGLFSGKSGTDLQFKTLTSTGATVTITDEGDTINLESSGVGSVWTGSTNVATYNGDNSLETAIKLVNSASGVGVNDGLIIGIQSSNTYFINKESGYIVFRTRPSFTDVDRLKIYNDGTVQVVNNSGGLVIGNGTSTTPATMGVYGTSGNAHFSSGTYGYTTSNGMFVGIGTGVDAHGYAWVKEDLPFIIKTDDTERLRVKGDGDVGIGFPNYNDGTAITSRLHVRGEGNTSATTTLTIENFDGTDLLSVKDDGTVNISNIGSTTSVTNLAVDASGNVVSGTTGGGGSSPWVDTGSSISYSGHGDYVEFKDKYLQIAPNSISNTIGANSNQSTYIGTGITAAANSTSRTLVLGINHTVAGTSFVSDSIIAGSSNTIGGGSNNLIVGQSLTVDAATNAWIGGNVGNNITNISDSLIFSTGIIQLTDTMVDCVILGNSSFGVKGDTVFGFGDDLYGNSTSNSEVMMLGFNVQLSNPASKSIVIGAGQDDGQYLKIDSNYEKGIYFGVGSTKPWFALTEAQSGVGTGTSGKVGNIFFGVDITDEGGTANVGEGIMWLQESTVNPSANITNAGALYNSGGTITWWDGTTNYNLTSSGGGGGEINTASNIGGGEGLFSGKSGVDLQFKSLTSTGGTVTITSTGSTVNLESSGGGGLNYISAGAVATNLETTSNWDINGVYTGATATGSQGDCHVDSAYWFTCVATNTWIRLIRG